MTALALSEASARVLARAGDGLRPGNAQARVGAEARPRFGGLHRTGAPVLRDSIEAGTFEDVFFAMPAPASPTGCSPPAAARPARDADLVGDRTRACCAHRRRGARVRGDLHARPPGTAAASSRAKTGSPMPPASAVQPSHAGLPCWNAPASSSASAASSAWTGRGRTIARPPTPIVRCCLRACAPICRVGCAPHRCPTTASSTMSIATRRRQQCSPGCRAGARHRHRRRGAWPCTRAIGCGGRRAGACDVRESQNHPQPFNDFLRSV